MKTEGWQKRLRDVIKKASECEFSWGRFDCVTFGYECVQAVTEDTTIGQRVHEMFGSWKSCRDAITSHKNDLSGSITKFLGEPVGASRLQMGDIGVAEIHGREAVVVNDGAQFLCPAEGRGLQTVPRMYVKHGWVI